MERLDTQLAGHDSYLEAAIHIARYASISQLVKGKKVLDIACGEGFGAQFLASFEPESVLAIDNSVEAIDKARRLYKSELVEFRLGDANYLEEGLSGKKFDVICSFETFEHLDDPSRYIAQMKRLLTPGGVIAISCPNDHWYYPEPETSNPFHVRKYTFHEFKEISEKILGKATYWFSGIPTVGFQNTQTFPHKERTTLGSSWLETEPTVCFDVGTINDPHPQEITPSYWMGIWGDSGMSTTSAQARISMETLSQYYETFSSWQDRVPSLRALESKLNETRIHLQFANEQNRLLLAKLERAKSSGETQRTTAIAARRFVEKYTSIAKRILPVSVHDRVYEFVSRLLK